MNFKKTIILAAVLCFLLLVFYLIESPLKNSKKHEQPLFISGFDKASAAAIIIKSKDKGEVQLQKKPEGWIVAVGQKTYQADKAPIDNLLDTVGKIKIEAVASKNPKKYKEFEVDQDKGVEVRIEDGAKKPLAHFYVGKSGPDLFSTYLRLADAEQVVLASGMLKMAFDRELKDWRDKTIFALNQQDITDYEVKGDKGFHLKKGEKDQWEVIAPEKFSPKKETAEDCLKTVSSLNAADFTEGPLKDFQLDQPAQEILVTMKAGATRTLMIGKEKNAFQRFVKTPEADTIYVLENYNMEKLVPPLDKFKQGEPGKDKKQDPGQPVKQEETKIEKQGIAKDKKATNTSSKTQPKKKKSRKKR
jgi:hypothetical protein